MRSLPHLLLAATLLAVSPVLAQTQAEMNAKAAADFQRADARLNAVYAKLRAALDEEGRDRLKTAQRAWVAFRDAEAALAADTEARGGSMAPLVYATAQEELTTARIGQLRKMLATAEAGGGE